MKVIEKIEIEKFRSFGQGQKKKVNIICEDINIYSGKNNSGKSNILKALNLFFNKNTSFGENFLWEKDYNKAYTGSTKGGIREIKITIHFSKHGKAILKDGFRIERKFLPNGDIIDKFYGKGKKEYTESQDTKQFRTFLSKIRYVYIPAVREKDFIKTIFTYLQEVLDVEGRKSKTENYEEIFEKLNTLLGSTTAKISNDFEKFIGMNTSVNAPTNILDILEGITIQTDPGIKIEKTVKGKSVEKEIKIPTDQSGDGVIMAYIPYFLNYISQKISKNMFIWGFEEPENSLEYSKIQDLANYFFKEFKKRNQIFLTTHSPAFILLKEKEGVILHRVYKELTSERLSVVETIEELMKQRLLFGVTQEEIDLLNEEINFLEFTEDAGKIWKERWEQDNKLEDENKKMRKELGKIKPPKVFVCEDKRGIKIWEKFFKDCGVKGVKILSSEGSTKDDVEISINQIKREIKTYCPKVFRSLDRDGWILEQIIFLEKELLEKNKDKASIKNYKLSFLPVNEIENFAIINNNKFDEKEVKKEKIKLSTEFNKTADTNIRNVINKFRNSSKEDVINKIDILFKKDDREKAKVRMIEKAKEDYLKFFPGKDIAKLKNNFNVERYLLGLKKEDYPQELKDYLKEIKNFFDN